MTVEPTRAEFEAMADDDEPVVIRAELPLDVETTPLDAYAALVGRTSDAAPGEYAFLLESAEKVASSDPDGAFAPATGADRHARYSFVGYDPAAVVTVEPDGAAVEVLDDRYAGLVGTGEGDTLSVLRGALPDVPRRGFPESERQHLDGGLVGFLSYDAVYDLWLSEVGRTRPDSRFPDAQFVLTTKTLVFDHARESASLVFTPIVRPDEDAGARYDDLVAETERVRDLIAGASNLETGGFRRDREVAGPQAEYEEAVRRMKEHILDGDIYQAVPSRTRELYGEIDPIGLYAALRDINPSPYMYLLSQGDLSIVGASPETLVSVRGREIMSNPIAGTCSRGSSPVEDRRLAGEMLADEKELAEHTMLVDLARNDVRRVAEPGSVRVDEFMNVLKYSHVQHIESTVTATLAPDADAFDAARATFPAGTLSGAPKIRAMELIDEYERSPRGPYGGGVGYFSWAGDADFAIVIRTATIEHGDEDLVTVRAGGGIVADSEPTKEYEETEKKMRGVLDAIERIEGGEEDPSGETADEEEVEPEVSD